jgi:hypothetical protein
MNRSPKAPLADLLGATNSLLCMVHCAAMPLLIAMGAAFLHHPAVSLAFIALAAWAVHAAARQGGHIWLVRFLWAAWAVFAITLLVEELHHGFEWMSLTASGLLVLGHVLHWRFLGMRRAIA